MEPGRLSRDGFLGNDSRTLQDIIAADLATLQAAGIERENAANLLDELHEAADEALETPKTVCNGQVALLATEVRGRISCPFGCGTRVHKANIRIQARGLDLLLTPLSTHMIRRHGFFQGRGSPFRIEPDDLVTLYRICRSGTSGTEKNAER